MSKFFHFGTENRADQLKKTPCMIHTSRLSRSSSTCSTMSAPGARWALEKNRNLDLADVQDDSEQVLVSLVLLFCPDMLDLVERAKVEAAQLKFATLLQRYLKHKWV